MSIGHLEWKLSVHGKWIGHFLTLGRLLVSIGVDLGQEGLSTLNIDFLTTNTTFFFFLLLSFDV